MYQSLGIDAVFAELQTSLEGLDKDRIAKARSTFGYNELPHKKRSVVLLFLRQFHDVLIYILFGALLLAVALRVLEGSASVGHSIDIIAIVAILILNGVLGFVQEFRAEQELESLQQLTSPQVRVRRGGRERLMASKELLPGDIVIIEAGDRIAADGRLVVVSHLELNESSLTGESQPVHKTTDVLGENLPIAENKNLVYAGTLVTRGSGEYAVTAIGTMTEIGRIATLVSEAKTPPTPLENRMKHVSALIGMVVVTLCMLLATLQFARGEPMIAVVLLAVSLAVSAVPEGLPAVVTVSLAMGVRRMAGKNALVRKLDALETLGSITVICTDKTGTITENKMKVVETWVPARNKSKEQLKRDEALLIQIAASCNRAQLPNLGDPTEVGLLRYAEDRGIGRIVFDEEEVPFTSEGKYMQTRHGDRSFLKGAPEQILALCDEKDKKTIVEKNAEYARMGIRVLGMAILEHGNIRFVGLMGLEDPPRATVARALFEAASAGIRTVMITGDNADTAAAVARNIGIEGDVMEGTDIENCPPMLLRQKVRTTAVYARVSPQHKVDICKALQANAEIVAMTGDGVNDAPALKAAHVGISMGKDGTQVAREAASLILTDDNYATIVAAIREGRHLYDNIRKFIIYLVRANVAQLVLISLTVILGMPLPLLPLHILWINLMTDGLPALALSMEPEEPGIMNRPPRRATEHLFHGEWLRIMLAVALGCGLTFIVFLWSITFYDSLPEVRAITFTFSILFELVLAFASRSSKPLWRIGIFSNPWLIASALLPLLLQFALLYSPLHEVFEITALSFLQWTVLLAIAGIGLMLLETSKLLSEKLR